MLSISHWGMHKVDVAGLGNFKETLSPRDIANQSNALTSLPQTTKQSQAAAQRFY